VKYTQKESYDREAKKTKKQNQKKKEKYKRNTS